MTLKEAALTVLREENCPLSAKKIAQIGLARQHISSNLKSPASSISAQINADIKN